MNTGGSKLETQIRPIDEASLELAKQYLRQGQVVAFPTETVYGLGAWAMSKEGIARIYQSKGRPSDNPLIVHIAPGFPLKTLVKEIPGAALPLMERFWPGPLTLIMPKGQNILPQITGGLETVAIRMPAHPAALALLKKTGIPIVAPSANSSGRPSPTRAVHVQEDMQGKIPLILDGGECPVGVESTVLDLTGEVPTILRPGAVTKEMLETVLPRVEVDPAVLMSKSIEQAVVPKAPGMKYRHYAPKGQLIVTDADAGQMRSLVLQAMENVDMSGGQVGIIVTRQMAEALGELPAEIICLGDRSHPEELAANLFGALRAADEKKLTLIYGEALAKEGIGEATMNRFLKASSRQLWLNHKEEI